MKKYSIAIAGTTSRTKQCAQALFESDLFEITFIITPIAKPVGRKQVITASPMEIFAKENKISTIFVEKKLDSLIQEKVAQLPQPDLLLVVDFGYIVPKWLLELPKIAPLNIHPSELPKWRGSSPGQFAILFNEKESAVTLMVMDERLDHGPIIHQDFFEIDHNWGQTEYYQHAFNLMCQNLDTKIATFAQDSTLQNQIVATPQPETSPTLTAKQIKKEQTFIPWEYLQLALNGKTPDNITQLSLFLQTAVASNGSLANMIERAIKAFSPWPGVWTIVGTNNGEKRMKLLEVEVSGNSLHLKSVHIEGKNPANWTDIKNSIQQ